MSNGDIFSGLIDGSLWIAVNGFILWMIIRYVRGSRKDRKNKKSAQARYDLSKVEVERRRGKSASAENSEEDS